MDLLLNHFPPQTQAGSVPTGAGNGGRRRRWDVYGSVNAYIHAYMYICEFLYLYTFIDIDTDVDVYLYLHIYMYVYMYMDIYR